MAKSKNPDGTPLVPGKLSKVAEMVEVLLRTKVRERLNEERKRVVAETFEQIDPKIVAALTEGHAIPSLDKWNRYYLNGGKRHSYDYIMNHHLKMGHRRGMTKYNIAPVANQKGRHVGYRASVHDQRNPGIQGPQDLGMFTKPHLAIRAVRAHHDQVHGVPVRESVEPAATSTKTTPTKE